MAVHAVCFAQRVLFAKVVYKQCWTKGLVFYNGLSGLVIPALDSGPTFPWTRTDAFAKGAHPHRPLNPRQLFSSMTDSETQPGPYDDSYFYLNAPHGGMGDYGFIGMEMRIPPMTSFVWKLRLGLSGCALWQPRHA